MTAPEQKTGRLTFTDRLSYHQIDDLLFWAAYRTREKFKRKTKDLRFVYSIDSRELTVRLNGPGKFFVAQVKDAAWANIMGGETNGHRNLS